MILYGEFRNKLYFIFYYLKYINDGRFLYLVALGNDLLLGNEDLLRRNLNAHVSPSNHDAVRLRNDLINVVDTLLVLNLGDDLDGLALLAKDTTDLLHTSSITDEGSKHHVHIHLNAKEQV